MCRRQPYGFYLVMALSCLLMSCRNSHVSQTIVGSWHFPSREDYLLDGDGIHYEQIFEFHADGTFSLRERYFSTGRSYVGSYKLHNHQVELHFTDFGAENLKGFAIGEIPKEPLVFSFHVSSTGTLQLLPVALSTNDSESAFISPRNFMQARAYERL
jgi:hypothetical protein